ncbi:Disease resistance protein RGA2 [Rhynchospora pubera]|uniref:Disease resistance protein RGA2 n=1 Tax=Rhynchospora pubera TaxID=906938 RepID=A0AAV8HS34_9POAL|nr:Disease resistance protein RGA2 [Rhynchospora pubera]
MAEAVVILAFVGKAVASSVITNLVNRAFTKFDELRKSEGMKATKEKLDQNLPRIAAVLLAVDRGQIMDRNGALDKWLWQLRDAVEEAEDAIDQLDYYQLKEKVKYQADPHNACTTSIKKKMTKLIKKHVPCIGDDSLGRLKKAVEGLNNAAAGVGPFLQLVNTLGNSSGGMNQTCADTGAMLTEVKVFGRDMEKDLILKWLSNPDGPEVSTFSIVGMGGLGKTTLARLIYNEIAEKKVLEFSLVVWVSVSDIFGTPDAKVIIRMILQDITQLSYDLNNLNTLQTSLKKKVETEKFLIIFDDVWQDGPETENQWKQILAPLKFGQKGSKILLTTRMEVVANMMAKVMEGTGQKNNHLLHLQSLFIEFEGEKPELADVKEFEKSLKKLKTLRLLRLTGDNLFELPKVVGDLIHLRYISVRQTSEKELSWLPKSISSLYHLKIMGFLAVSVNGVTNDKLYGIGNLISLQYLDVPSSVMEMIPRIGKLTSLQKLELFNSQEQGRNISELGSLNSISELQINSLEKLNDSEEANKAKIKEKERLRVLSLNWSSECSNSKMTLENLEPHNSIQKLHISGYRDVSFPKWISNSIPNLTSLELRDCARCNTLPPLGKLLSLKYLFLSNFHELELIPAAFYGRILGGGDAFPSLKDLRISSMNILRKWEDIEGRRKFPRLEKLLIEGCPQLTTLPTLPVSISNLEIKNSGLQTLPMGIESLKRLRLVGCQMLLFNQTQHNGLPSSLKELIIQGFCDDTSLASSLRNLVSLTRLELASCSNITSLPQEDVFSKLVSLCEISIQKCKNLSSLGGLGALTSLKVLRLSGCSNLVTIPLPQSPSDPDSEEPNLEIQQLHIDHISLLLQKPLKSVCQVKKLHILDNHQPESLPKQWLEDCTSLEEIEIGNAGALKGLPSNFDELLPGLKKLVMHQANLFESLPNLPPSLSDLVITGCNETFEQKYKKDTGSNWYELADVTTVIIL